ncbi:MAG: sugar ABC transporter permease YjfF [Lachnospiraceae bacterium]|nr:sugar ABC transporter permease YjfF [Lachnospiraceae bacterium]
MSSNKSAVSDKGIAAKIKNVSDTNLLLTITIVVFFVMYIGAIIFQGSGFLKPQTFFNILNQNATLIIVSCGMSMVMIAGGIDISVGGLTALVCMCCAVYLDFMGGNLVVSVLIALAIGLAFGIVQGFLVAYLDIQPFIVTLAGMFFARGMTTVVYKEPFNVAHEGFKELKLTRLLIPKMGSYTKKGAYIDAYVELGVVVALIIVVIMFCVLRWTKLGRSFYAVGGNSQSAVMLGINVKRTKFITHLLSGILAGIGGYAFFLHTGAGSPAHATGMEMNAIAASIIGGTMLTGGVGNIIGTFFGVLSLSTIQIIVATAGLGEAWWTNITIASMLCIFLILQSVIMAWKHRA